jgi:hypothetical protein
MPSKLPPALKHGIYSTLAVLPGEDLAAFEKLRGDVIADQAPQGPLEEDIVEDLARLLWRKKNLTTIRLAECTRSYCSPSYWQKDDLFLDLLNPAGRAGREEAEQAAQKAQTEVGDLYKLVEVGAAATFDGLRAELAIREQLDAIIDKCLKRLLFVRGLKSLSAPSPAHGQARIPGSAKAA